jgi:hypothetical protein
MNNDERKLKEDLCAHITLPQCVEEKMQEAYQVVQNGEKTTNEKGKYRMKKWVTVAAAAVLTCTTTFGVWAAATGFFSKETVKEGDTMSYQFEVDYELVPGKFEVEASYLPPGLKEQEEGMKYYEDDYKTGITVMPVTTVDLERIGNEMEVSTKYLANVEHTKLAGMDADIVTYNDEQLSGQIFMFNEQDGYVLELFVSDVPMEEAKKFADGLKVTRVGDDAYETADEKAQREQEELGEKEEQEKEQQALEARNKKGMQASEFVRIGTAGTVESIDSNGASYKAQEFTVVDAQFTDSIAGYAKENFYDYSALEPYLNPDGTLKPYTRVQLAEEDSMYDNEVMKEEEVNQQFLVVKARVKKLGIDTAEGASDKDTPLYANLVNMVKREDDSYTWSSDIYYPKDDDYSLQTDNSAIFFDQAEFTEPDVRNHFFFRTMEQGDELEYTLIFVVDEDLKDQMFLRFEDGSNGDETPMLFDLKK